MIDGPYVDEFDKQQYLLHKEAAEAAMVRVGVFRKKDTVTEARPQGYLYQMLLLARHHTTGEQFVVYIPLRVEPEWAGTVRVCVIPRGDWDSKFEYVGEGLPMPCERQ